MSAKNEATEVEGDNGDSPLTHVVVEYYDGPAGSTEPLERTTMVASEEPAYALGDGDTGHLWEHIAESVKTHVKGECDCTPETPHSPVTPTTDELAELVSRIRQWKYAWETKDKDGARAFEYCADALEEIIEATENP